MGFVKMTRKNIFDTMDELEGRDKGESFRNLKKELKRQGYKCDFNKHKVKCVKKINLKGSKK